MSYFLKAGKLNIVFGGQAGSESKGKFSGYIVDKEKPDIICMTSSPNAGHTVITPGGDKKVTYNLPVGAVFGDAKIFLGPASVINIETLKKEICLTGIDPGRITIDPRASIISDNHIEQEKSGCLSDIGSTLQGVGECRVSKMNRRGYPHHILVSDIKTSVLATGVNISNEPVSIVINEYLNKSKTILAEGTQGFDLDPEHGIDPIYCTSKMINPSMIAAELGVSPKMVGEIISVVRPYPIRVNNRTGTSGPYSGSVEISWDTIRNRCGCPHALDEITTTTKLRRRVFEFSVERYQHMVNVCRPTAVCLQFANYLDWSVNGVRTYDELTKPVIDFVDRLNALSGGKIVRWVGTGACHLDMINVDN